MQSTWYTYIITVIKLNYAQCKHVTVLNGQHSINNVSCRGKCVKYNISSGK